MQRITVPLSLLLVSVPLSLTAQNPRAGMPPDYRGPQTIVPGIFVTPIPNAPFTATVEIVSHQKLPDGTENVRTTTAHIARASSGRIYNERRQLMPPGFKGESQLLSAHIYDPNSRLNIFLDPFRHLARESTFAGPPTAPTNSVPSARPSNNPNYQEIDLGEQSIDGTTLHGIEKQRTLPAAFSGTGQPITITDQYWYSPDLSVYLIIKHNDPRYGEQLVAVTHIDRREPQTVLLSVPTNYKVVDENPPQESTR